MPHAVTPVPTPNPSAMRFTFATPVFGATSRSFANAAAARGTPWAAALFAVPGVKSLFAVNDFVTVTKERAAAWEAIVPPVLDVLRGASF